MLKYEFVIKFQYWIPGGFSEVKSSTYSIDANNYATAINEYNNYIYNIFRGLRSEIISIKRRRIKCL